MLHIALVEPEIAPNTGNIGRLCAATGTRLHLVGRLGFRLDDRSLRRAGIDYWHLVDCVRHADWAEFAALHPHTRCWFFSVRAQRLYTQVSYMDGDCLVFGCESRGLPAQLLAEHPEQTVQIPMRAAGVRSLNLATAVGIGLYEAIRQIG